MSMSDTISDNHDVRFEYGSEKSMPSQSEKRAETRVELESRFYVLTNQTSAVSSTDPDRASPPSPTMFRPNPTTSSFSTTNSAVAPRSSVENGVEFLP